MYFTFFISFLRYVIHLLRYTDGSGPSFRIHLFKVFFRFPVSGFHRSMQPYPGFLVVSAQQMADSPYIPRAFVRLHRLQQPECLFILPPPNGGYRTVHRIRHAVRAVGILHTDVAGIAQLRIEHIQHRTIRTPAKAFSLSFRSSSG